MQTFARYHVSKLHHLFTRGKLYHNKGELDFWCFLFVHQNLWYDLHPDGKNEQKITLCLVFLKINNFETEKAVFKKEFPSQMGHPFCKKLLFYQNV